MNTKHFLFNTILLIVIFYPSFLIGQRWLNLDNRWRVIGECTGGFGVGTYPSLNFFKDSVEINGQYYYELYQSVDSTLQVSTPTQQFFREERGIVYQLDGTKANEEIIYNFNLKTGDSIVYGKNLNKTVVIVVAVDTVTLLDSSKRKRWTLTNPKNPNAIRHWIEAIGSVEFATMAPYAMFFSDCVSSFSCYFFKDQYLYGQGTTCPKRLGSDPVSTKQVFTLKGIKVIRNLGDGNISFRLENSGQYQCKIYDTQGKLLKTQPIQQGNNHCTVADFPKGVYFLNIYDYENNLQKTLKILHQ